MSSNVKFERPADPATEHSSDTLGGMLNGLRMLLGSTLPAMVIIVPTMLAQAANGNDGEFTNAATRHLIQAVQSQRDGSHLTRLSALRELRDPAMQPLFYDLLQHDEWQVQVHALLGLAEIDPEQGLDPWLTTQVDPLAREQAIPYALDMDLLNLASMQKLLEWDRLESSQRVLLSAELMHRSEPIDVEQMRTLANDNNLDIASIAALLLAELGDKSALSAIDARLKQASSSERMHVLQKIFDAIRLYEFKSPSTWLDNTLQEVDDEGLQYWGTFTLLEIDPVQGTEHWRRNLGEMPTYRQQVRAALQLLEAELPMDAETRKQLGAEEDELLGRLSDAANAIAERKDVPAAMNALLDTGHPRSIEWAMRHVDTLPADQAREVHLHLIGKLDAPRRSTPPLLTHQAIRAMSKLIEVDSPTATGRLLAADDDSMTQVALLLGSMQSPTPELLESARTIRRIGASRADSLTLLLMARDSTPLSEQDLKQLGRVAAGGGMIDDMRGTQAAWLYLKHRGELDTALLDIASAH